VDFAIVSAAEPEQVSQLAEQIVQEAMTQLGFSADATARQMSNLALVAEATGAPAAPSLQETAHKAAGEIEIDAGENVMLGRTGRLLGHVRDVLVEDRELIGIVMRPGGLFKHDVVLPVRFLDRGDDLALFADLTEDDLHNLRPFQP